MSGIFKSCFLLGVFFFFVFISEAQDTVYARQVINKLCSEKFAGRGYVRGGDKTAAEFIAAEFKRLGVSKPNSRYFQPFNFPVNSFPSRMQLKVNNKNLEPGKDFIVHPSSASGKGKYKVEVLRNYNGEPIPSKNNKICYVVYKDSISSDEYRNLISDLYKNKINIGCFLLIEPKKLTWSVGISQFDVAVITVLQNHAPKEGDEVFLNIKSVFRQHHTQNVIGIIHSKVQSDSTIVFTAHYDHLGMMGKDACFPGANDNASGTSMLLNLAKYYSSNSQSLKYNIMFIAFAGEEAGLIGSKFYTENPILPLTKIKFLINMDLMGTGDEGMMVVNATEYKEHLNLLNRINNERKYLVKIGERGKAKNSDHYYFSENNVPCFFFYTMGGIAAYHDVYDIPSTLPLTEYSDVFRLIIDFVSELK